MSTFNLSAQSISFGTIEEREKVVYSQGPSYQNEIVELHDYINTLGYDLNDYKYIVIYPWNKQLYTDNHWERLFKSDYHFRDILVVFVFDFFFKRYEAVWEMDKKKYLALDSMNLFQQQAFYSYAPILYKTGNGEISEKYYLGWTYGYHKKAELFQQLKTNN